MVNENNTSSVKELIDLGLKYYNNEEYKEAVKSYRTALLMKDDINSLQLASLYVHTANAYYKMSDIDKATYFYEKYLEAYPNGQSSVYSRLAHSYYYLDTDKCVDYHNKGLNLEVNAYDSGSKIFAMTKSAYYSQQDIKEEAEYEALQVKNALYKNVEKYNHEDKKQNKDKRLNIGYLTSDCHTHTMMNYIIPIWENHNTEKFNITVFGCSEKIDSTTEKIKNLNLKFIDCSKLDVKTLAKTIYDEKIDILVDLGGYTHMKSYVAFYKPAPIIVSYLGYLNTLGIKEVDYILATKFAIPEENKCLYTEKPLYLDLSYQIFSPKNYPEITNSPFEQNGYITFGSFNCTSKFNDTVFYIWSKILKRVPNSKLLIYRTQMTRRIIKYLKDKFEKLGIDENRIIYSSKAYSPHYKAYALADISLDPYPFSGMSIAIETALMGVPTITLSGEGIQSCGVKGVNISMGLEELNATTGEDYINAAVNLANNKEKLIQLRTSMRDKILNSSICKCHKEFTMNLEEKYELAWKNFIHGTRL